MEGQGSCPANAPKGDSIDTRPAESTTPKTPQMFGEDPNIQGFLKLYRGTAQNASAYGNGVFSISQTGLTGPAPSDGAGDVEITFKASKGNSTYSGNNIQVPALSTLPCIRV